MMSDIEEREQKDRDEAARIVRMRRLAESYRILCGDCTKTDRALMYWDGGQISLVEQTNGHLRPTLAVVTKREDRESRDANAYRLAFGWEAIALLSDLFPAPPPRKETPHE